MRSPLLKEVDRLYKEEGASAIGFLVLWFGIAIVNPGSADYLLHPAVLFSFLNICLILLTGSMFWKVMRHCLQNNQRVLLTERQHAVFRTLHLIVIAWIVLSSALILLYQPFSSSMWLLIGLTYGFMWLEYINYFHIRLSYLTPREFRQLLRHRTLAKSHLNRALHSRTK